MDDYSVYIFPAIIVFGFLIVKYLPNLGQRFRDADKKLYKENYELRDSLIEVLKDKKK